MSFIDVDDEVIIIEPAFDIYLGALKMAGADIKSVKLVPNSENINCSSQLELDWDTLEKKLSKSTKAVEVLGRNILPPFIIVFAAKKCS
mgnify:CR=1 FL=1